MNGGPGDDLIRPGPGNDFAVGSLGRDTLDLSDLPAPVSVDLPGGTAVSSAGAINLNSIENVIGTPFDDTIIGDDADNRITVFGGSDNVFCGAGQDTVVLPVTLQDITAARLSGNGGFVISYPHGGKSRILTVENVELFEFAGGGSPLTQHQLISASSNFRLPQLADFDNDGGDDLLFQRGDGTTGVINGEGGFQLNFGAKPLGGIIAIGDLNGGGAQDIVVRQPGGFMQGFSGADGAFIAGYGPRDGFTLLDGLEDWFIM